MSILLWPLSGFKERKNTGTSVYYRQSEKIKDRFRREQDKEDLESEYGSRLVSDAFSIEITIFTLGPILISLWVTFQLEVG